MAITEKEEIHVCEGPGHQGYELLLIAFTLLPIIAGLDKFFHLFAKWDLYLSPSFNFFGNVHLTMQVVGVIEIVVGILVWIMPRVFSYVVALWLLLIIINLLMQHTFYDIALRDFALLLGALALGRLSEVYCCKRITYRR